MTDVRPAWDVTIDVASFITANVTPCADDLDTEYPKLAPPTDKTTELWRRCEVLLEEEIRRCGVLSVDPKTPAKATSHPPRTSTEPAHSTTSSWDYRRTRP